VDPERVLTEELNTGWGPDVPIDDTLLRRAIFANAAAARLPVEAVGGRVRVSETLSLSDRGHSAEFLNAAHLLRPLADEEWDGLMEEADTFFSDGHGEALFWNPWTTPDLSRYGWELAGYPPMMCRPAGGEMSPVPAGLRVERVRDPDALALFDRTSALGFPFEDLQNAPPATVHDAAVLRKPELAYWLGWEGDDPVGVSAVTLAAGCNFVSLVVTLPEARGRGYGEALTWAATMFEPDKPAVLLASDLGRPVYERMGYVTIMRFALWVRERPAT
jgi:GNAT superfamily N-acetyltransferase